MHEIDETALFQFIREIRRNIDLMHSYSSNPVVAQYHFDAAQTAVDSLSQLYSA